MIGAENHGNANFPWHWGKLAFLTAEFLFFSEKNGMYILCEPSGWILHVCMYVYFDSVVHYTCYVYKFGQIKLILIHPEPKPTPESLEDCGWVLKRFPTRLA